MADSDDAFTAAIDERHDATQSVVLRYRRAVRLEDADGDDQRVKDALSGTSVREGLRLVPLLEHRGVRVDVLDETSRMHTNTIKAIDGCLTAAKCLTRGVRTLVVESGGNTAAALAAYAQRAGLDIVCFVPEENLDLIDGESFGGAGPRLIAVADPALVKPTAERFASARGAWRVPELAWRLQAARFVGCFLREQLLRGERFDWLAQTISAAFGPIGIYAALDDGGPGANAAPRFLGVQQAPNCPMYRAWSGATSGVEAVPLHSTRGLLTPVMYDGAAAAYGTYPQLAALLERTHGALTTIDADEFSALVGHGGAAADVLGALRCQDIDIGTCDDVIVERTGMIAVAGVLKEIAAGRIAAGSRVLVCLTSGVRSTRRPALPERRLSDPTSIESFLRA